MDDPTPSPTDELMDAHAALLKQDSGYAAAWEQVQRFPAPVRFLALALRYHGIAATLRLTLLNIDE